MKDLCLKLLQTMVCFYIVGVFCSASFDMSTWPQAGRALLGIYMGIVLAVITLLHYLNGPTKK